MSHVLRASRWATNGHFFVNGLAYASWGVNVPVFKQLHQLNEAEVSLAMLAAGLGALLGVLQAGRLVGRWGARRVCLVCGLSTVASLGGLLWLPVLGLGVASLLLFGLANSIYDVAMNAHAVEVEAAYGRPIMSSCHGFFSVGGLTGALIGSLFAMAGVSSAWHMLLMSLFGAALCIAVLPLMLPDIAATPGEQGHSFRRPHGLVLLLGLMAALSLIGEGSMYDWSVLYMRDTLQSPQHVAALAYAAFSVAMAMGRFGGDFARAHWGATTLLRLSGTLAACALVLVLLTDQPLVALLGFALVGLGISNMSPVLFTCAARIPGIVPAHGIAGVAALGYLAFLAGPPLIGMVAQLTSLPMAFGLVALFLAAMALLARRAIPAGK